MGVRGNLHTHMCVRTASRSLSRGILRGRDFLNWGRRGLDKRSPIESADVSVSSVTDDNQKLSCVPLSSLSRRPHLVPVCRLEPRVQILPTRSKDPVLDRVEELEGVRP